ncbi:GMC family oxidoreductase N-terminal domain-containing protein [Haloechinothrix sp. YIM 98757]|uniref:GMC family oxidoreductase N-terminal domain-containing protein n=1 Tax=Haloechinothrix aidingensis TaxID=2752311 RepID=A0A838ABX5_9PSEU|nr:GMC family oxidoreductase N-terminal domain-containing protein [Haloechinothrix aidingensis]
MGPDPMRTGKPEAMMAGKVLGASGSIDSCVYVRGDCAIGVEYRLRGRRHRTHIRDQVVVGAGATAAPNLLQLSGAGLRNEPERLGTDVLRDCPGAGERAADQTCRHRHRDPQSSATPGVTALAHGNRSTHSHRSAVGDHADATRRPPRPPFTTVWRSATTTDVMCCSLYPSQTADREMTHVR